jgi:REP element-mobilizing transposase RayT
MSEPLAFLLTWTCYGAWLHGDDRGSVDDDHNGPPHGLAPPDELRRSINAFRMASDALVLTTRERCVVQTTIQEHCKHQEWWLGACNVRTNHLHCVVSAPSRKPERVVQQLKSWSSRALRAHNPERFAGRIWTRHASTRYLWRRNEVERAMRYVLEAQDDPRRWDRSEPRAQTRGPRRSGQQPPADPS